jgi:hypothetical protein
MGKNEGPSVLTLHLAGCPSVKNLSAEDAISQQQLCTLAPQ